jgi:fumarate hydratase class II
MSRVAAKAENEGRSIRETVLSEQIITPEEFDALIAPEAVCRLGMPGAAP